MFLKDSFLISRTLFSRRAMNCYFWTFSTRSYYLSTTRNVPTCFKGTPPQQWKAVTDYWQKKKRNLLKGTKYENVHNRCNYTSHLNKDYLNFIIFNCESELMMNRGDKSAGWNGKLDLEVSLLKRIKRFVKWIDQLNGAAIEWC